MDLPTIAPSALPGDAGLIACDRLRAKLPARTCLGLQAKGTTECAGCPVGCAVRTRFELPAPEALVAKEVTLAGLAKLEAARHAREARAHAKRLAAKAAARVLCTTPDCGALASRAPATYAEAIGKCKTCRYEQAQARAAVVESSARTRARVAAGHPLCTRCERLPRAKAQARKSVPAEQKTWCGQCRGSARRALARPAPALLRPRRIPRAA